MLAIGKMIERTDLTCARRFRAMLAAGLLVLIASCGEDWWIANGDEPKPGNRPNVYNVDLDDTDYATRRGEIIGELGVHTARHEDTLIDLARAHDLGFVELAAANQGVDV